MLKHETLGDMKLRRSGRACLNFMSSWCRLDFMNLNFVSPWFYVFLILCRPDFISSWFHVTLMSLSSHFYLCQGLFDCVGELRERNLSYKLMESWAKTTWIAMGIQFCFLIEIRASKLTKINLNTLLTIYSENNCKFVGVAKYARNANLCRL